ncbi:MAG: HDIG domain-containing protein [Bacillota bacterium]|nr:HDIG domain-containing protein [Bacillota bacterium]
MEDEKPSIYFEEKIKTSIFFQEYPFTFLGDIVDVEQSPKYHPEGSVWKHTMMVVDNAAQKKYKSKDSHVLMWAALLHDIGKAPTTVIRKGKITSYDHDKVGAEMAVEFLKQFTDDNSFIHNVSKLIRWHMQALFIVKGLPFADIGKMSEEVSVDEVALFTFCDRLGRGGMTPEKMEEEKRNVEVFTDKCRKYLSSKDKVLIEQR